MSGRGRDMVMILMNDQKEEMLGNGRVNFWRI